MLKEAMKYQARNGGRSLGGSSSLIRVRSESIAEYRRLHEQVPDAVQDRIRRCGIANYSIHLLGDRLIGYFEYHGDDLAADLAAMAADEPTQQWWRLTDPLQEPLPEAGPGGHWATAEQVFVLDEQENR